MEKLLTVLSDIIFPPRPDEVLVRTLTEEMVLACYSETIRPAWTALCTFSHPSVRALIHEAKFERNENAQMLLGALFTHYISKNPQHKEALFLPMPLSTKRLRVRGYNQVASILTYADVHMRTDVLVRVRDTRPQTELSREERFTNVKEAFACISPEVVYGKDIIIVDDVVTTGATLGAAVFAVGKYSPRSVTSIAIAH
jgi:ComF family protein